MDVNKMFKTPQELLDKIQEELSVYGSNLDRDKQLSENTRIGVRLLKGDNGKGLWYQPPKSSSMLLTQKAIGCLNDGSWKQVWLPWTSKGNNVKQDTF